MKWNNNNEWMNADRVKDKKVEEVIVLDKSN